jgi:hypothetical protein
MIQLEGLALPPVVGWRSVVDQLVPYHHHGHCKTACFERCIASADVAYAISGEEEAWVQERERKKQSKQMQAPPFSAPCAMYSKVRIRLRICGI